jgi:hypothetical protein
MAATTPQLQCTGIFVAPHIVPARSQDVSIYYVLPATTSLSFEPISRASPATTTSPPW